MGGGKRNGGGGGGNWHFLHILPAGGMILLLGTSKLLKLDSARYFGNQPPPTSRFPAPLHKEGGKSPHKRAPNGPFAGHRWVCLFRLREAAVTAVLMRMLYERGVSKGTISSNNDPNWLRLSRFEMAGCIPDVIMEARSGDNTKSARQARAADWRWPVILLAPGDGWLWLDGSYLVALSD